MHAKSPLHNAAQDSRSLLKIAIYGIFSAVRAIKKASLVSVKLDGSTSSEYGNTGLFLILAPRIRANACKNACKTPQPKT